MKLYEITEQFKQVENLDDVSPEAIQDTLDSIVGEFEEKGVAVLAYILNEQNSIDAMKSHKKDVDSKIKSMESRIGSLKEYLRYNMEVCGITKIESPLFKATLGKPSKIVDVSDEDLLDDKYIRIKREPIKSDISKDLKSGIEVSGARLIDGKPRLTIK